ncbi:MAG: amidohydrolase [Porticoccaceae bacterium]|nr:amidohydrolase [Porticoccaceae bacterium]MDG1474669.1 amidohydrolase [Porticoccaceae bacterium]
MNNYNNYKNLLPMIMLVSLTVSSFVQAKSELADAINLDYQDRLGAMFKDFHANPELSTAEFTTAKKMAEALRTHGFDVTESVGGTGIVALLENGPGPLVMMRADMDGLPVKEMSGLPYASKATQLDPITNKTFPVMHACGHDVHITSLIGTAKQMVDLKEHWSGTLMLIGQPAEERVIGARAMMEDNLWQRFGKPDYALAFHVSSILPSGVINVVEGAPFAGADTVDIYVRGIGAHGASPHAGKDPIVLGSQIVMALQTLVSRELSPRQPGVVTVGAFHSGTKHNIISELAHLQLTVRNTNLDTRDTLLRGIKRIAENLGRAAGLPEDKLPEVVYSEESTPPTVNNAAMARRLKQVWENGMGEDRVTAIEAEGMGAEDFPFFTTDPEITSVYFSVGGTDADYIAAARNGTGPAVPSHHSPIFKIEPKPAVTAGIEATVLALMDLLPAAN